MHSLHQTSSSGWMNIGVIIMFVLISETLHAQRNPKANFVLPASIRAYYTLDVPVDARSVAMGESFVAVAGTQSAHIFNPASLASAKGITVSYSRRGYTFVDPVVAKYQYVSASMYTSLVSVGLFYSRFDLETGTVLVSTTDFNYVWGATLAKTFGERFHIGATVKSFRYGVTEGSLSESRSTNSAMLFDIGAQYSANVILTGSSFHDELRGGVSLQNFGTDLRAGSMVPFDPQLVIPVPRYLRIGFAYRIERLPDRKDELIPFSMLVSGEYRNLLNPDPGQEDSRDFWGFGTELSFFEIASARTGVYIAPFDRWYGRRGEASFRYGLGLNIPLRHIADIPWLVSFDYSRIPITNGFVGLHDSFPVFSLEVQYLEDIF